MRAAVFRAPGSIEVQDVATPAPGAGEARVPLERIQDACEAALGKYDRLLKALVVCDGTLDGRHT